MKTIIPIQFLRAVAAIAVVASHFRFDLSRTLGIPALHPQLQLGDAGVDLFFVISGFVMVYASEPLFARAGGALTFFSHRVVRIVPLYWLATATYLLITAVVPGFARGYTVASIAASFFFIPYPRPDGFIQPVVGQGWTLNYEMFFYAIFAFGVLGSRHAAVAIASFILAGVVLAGLVFAPLRPALAFWSDPIVMEFVLGMLLALGYRQGLRLPRPVCLGLMFGGVALLIVLRLYAPTDPALRLVIWGVPAVIVVAGATLGDFSPSGAMWRTLSEVGNASYALYLFHAFPVRAMVYFVLWAKLDLANTYWPLLAITIVGAIAMAVFIHHIFERPVTEALRRYVGSTRNSAVGSAGVRTGESSP